MKSRGYSLIEAIVAIAVFSVVMVGFLTVFDNSAKVSKVQTAVSGAQENLRAVMNYITRYSRMAGSGGLPVVNPDPGSYAPQAVRVTEVPDKSTPTTDTTSGLTLVPQTDVLELWGAFVNPMFDIAPATYSYDGTSNGAMQIPDKSTVTGQDQDKTELFGMLKSGDVPVLLVSVQRLTMSLDPGRTRAVNQYGAAMMHGPLIETDPNFTFKAAVAGSDEIGSFNPGPSGGFPSGMTDVARVAVLNGYRLFVAYEPGTSVPTMYITNILSGTTEPVANDVVDLQVALGCDRYANGQLTEVGANAKDDQWLFNHTGESEADTFASATIPLIAYLTMLRVTVVTRAPAPEMDYTQPQMAGPGKAIPNEDGRDILADDPFMGQPAARYRYRALTEHVKLRALTPVL